MMDRNLDRRVEALVRVRDPAGRPSITTLLECAWARRGRPLDAAPGRAAGSGSPRGPGSSTSRRPSIERAEARTAHSTLAAVADA